MYTPIRFALIPLLALVAAGSAHGQANWENQVHIAGEPQAARARLEAIDRTLEFPQSLEDLGLLVLDASSPSWIGVVASVGNLLDDKQDIYLKALEEYRRLVLDEANQLAGLNEHTASVSARTSLETRRAVQHRLANLPPSIRARYRRSVRIEADKLLDEGKETRSPAPLRRLVRDLFCSDAAAEALDLLGDLAFEQGRFDEAATWWRHLTLLPSEHADATRQLLHPDPNVDLVRVQAKLILALVFQQRWLDAEREWQRFRHDHPEASGHLAGEKGRYASILAMQLEKAKSHLERNGMEPWTTFAGEFSRQRVLPRTLRRGLWIDGPTWRVPLPMADKRAMHRPASFHPIVAENQVLIADPLAVTSFDLETGAERFRYEHPFAKGELAESPHDKGMASWSPRYTLSYAEGRVFARLGRQSLGQTEEKPPPSVLVCLDIASKDRPGKLLWQITATVADNQPAYFEGAPVIFDRRVYIVMSRVNFRNTKSYLACYDLAGRQQWLHELCETPEFADGRGPRARPHLLTLAGHQLVYLTHAGAAVAVDAYTGERTWALRYPRLASAIEREGSPRDLAPALADQGRVYLAPSDSGSLFCVNAETGMVLWERESAELVHLLSVAQDRLLFATKNGIRAIDTATGATHGWQQPSVGRMLSQGRGLVAGTWYFWPTQDRLLPWRAVNMPDGSQINQNSGPDDPVHYEPTMLRHYPAGNVAFGLGSLVVAGTDELVCHVAPAKQEAALRAKFEHAPNPATRYRLGTVLADLGRTAESAKILAPLTDADWLGLLEFRRGKYRLPDGGFNVQFDEKPEPPANLPKLGRAFPLERAWTAEGRLLPVAGDADKGVFVVTGENVTCRDFVTGATRWQQKIDAARTVWAGVIHNTVIFGSDHRVEGFGVHTGTPWHDVHNFNDANPAYHLVDDQPQLRVAPGIYEGFIVIRGAVGYFFDRRQFMLMPVQSGLGFQHHHVPDSDLRPTFGLRYQPFVDVVNGTVKLQTSFDDELWSLPDWRRRYLEVDATLRLVGLPNGKVELRDLREVKPRWTFASTWKHSLTGGAAEVFGRRDCLLAAVPTNLGSELVRLDETTGKALWAMNPNELPDGVDSLAFDDRHVFLVSHNTVQGRSLADGTRRWRTTLPADFSRWRLERFGAVLLACPDPDVRVPFLSNMVWDVFAGAILQRWRAPASETPILLLNPADGSVVQRLVVPGSGAVRVQRNTSGVTVGVGNVVARFRPLSGE